MYSLIFVFNRMMHIGIYFFAGSAFEMEKICCSCSNVHLCCASSDRANSFLLALPGDDYMCCSYSFHSVFLDMKMLPSNQFGYF